MERRDFIKISAIAGATAALDSCGQPDVELIRFIPEEELTPGVATWKPSICTLCAAGCGTLVKVVEGDAEVMRHGRAGLIKMGLAKKIEGNPQHPISQGKLCPRGQAALQVTYHPDRIKGPLKRTGPRGSGQFQEISWDEAIQQLVSQLQALRCAEQELNLFFLTRPLRGQRRQLVERFLRLFSVRSPIYFDPFEDAVVRNANAYCFGYSQLPTYELANSAYVLSFGADFLGTWNSPVAQSVAYGVMRQGHAGRRAKFVQVEARMSLTGANADEWISVRPGTEGALALGLAHVMMREKLKRPQDAGRAGEFVAGWAQGLPDCTSEATEKRTGVAAPRIERIAREMAAHSPAVVIAGGAALAHTNGLTTAFAVSALNALLGSVGKPGGIFFSPQPKRPSHFVEFPAPAGSLMKIDDFIRPLLEGNADAAKVLMLFDANPVFATPPNLRVREALEKVPFIASFGSFMDETSILADLILPDHSPLESWLDDIPESGSTQAVVSLAPPVMRPLHNTRSMPDVLLEIARHLGGELSDKASERMPWENFEGMLKSEYQGFYKDGGTPAASSADEFWQKLQERGAWSGQGRYDPVAQAAAKAPLAKQRGEAREGFWWGTRRALPIEEASLAPPPMSFEEPRFDGDPAAFPFHFLPYESQAFGDGSLAHLPWLQEMPDPLATAMWSTWVEINPDTALKLNIKQGDLVEVASQHGMLQAPALVTPGIAPDVVAMPIGQGHTNYTRYASGRGANSISILAPMVVRETGSLAWAATRVKITKVGEGKLPLFGAELREHPHEHR